VQPRISGLEELRCRHSQRTDEKIIANPGVYREEIHPPGEHWIKILMPDGKVGTVRFPDELWDERVIPDLWELFDAKVPAKLKIV
jgi:hypothetical protein